MNISIALLAQRLGQHSVTSNAEAVSGEYAKALNAFELLCNLNLRDREIAREIISNDFTALCAAYPNAFSALINWATGDLIATRRCWVFHLEQFPCDIVASFLLHMFDFLHGYPDRYGEYLLNDARCHDPILGGFYQGILAFSLCEQGRYVEALPLALEAHQKNADDIYSLHALVHAWHGAGNHGTIVDHLQRAVAWRDNAGMNIHVNWHLAVSLLQTGHIKPSLLAYRGFRSLTAGHHAEQDLDAVNYCIRLYCSQLSRPTFSAEYVLLARNWAPSIYNSLSYFNDLHAAIAFMLAGDHTLLKKLRERPPLRGLDEDLQQIGQQLINAIAAFAEEDYSNCADSLQHSRSRWYRIGGSRAQREILEILLETALRFASGSASQVRTSETVLD
ncbi:hypothetical protein [Pseudomonas sp. B21-048]|uniref:hypothetical protein n=1 Tax=Pseudomonas sp. B21-048 TaxID=2895490 RepID=UPI00215E7866|nr:hypothetical protein [Pseudomonas sp. B21-048]UVL00424.1 hypothetical protein LOY56_08685 [Pseudomonas sp. B21-048]